MKGSDKERDADGKKKNPLDDAQGTGLQTTNELQLIARMRACGADEKSDKISDSPGKQESDHGGEPSIRMPEAAPHARRFQGAES